MTNAVLPGDREPDGRLLPGHALRSPGRPKGPTEADKIKAHLEPKKLAVLDKLAELAAAGDPRSIEVFLRYFSPGARPEDEKVVVPGLSEAPTLQAKATAILAAVASGHVSATAGDRLLAMLDRYGKAVVLDEHERRLQAIEGKGAPTRPAHPYDPAEGLV